MCASNLPCSQSPVRHSPVPQLLPRTVPGGFWGGRFDVKVFNPQSPSNRQSLSSCHRKHENIKKLAYERRVREVEHGSFTPLIMSLTVGLGSAATTCYKRLASLCSLPNGNSPTAVLWPGSVAACHSLFFSRQSGA